MENSNIQKLTLSDFIFKYNQPNDETIKELVENGIFEAPNKMIFEIILFLSIAINWLNNIPILKKYGISFRIDDTLNYHYIECDYSEIWTITQWLSFDYNQRLQKISDEIGINVDSWELWKIIQKELQLHGYGAIYSNTFKSIPNLKLDKYERFMDIDDWANSEYLSSFLFCFSNNFIYNGLNQILENCYHRYDRLDKIENLEMDCRTTDNMRNFFRTSGDNFNCFFLTDTEI